MTEAFLNPTYFVACSIGLAFSCVFFALAARPYKVEAANAIKLKSDVLISACNTAITVAGIGTPILAAIFAYASLQTTQPPGSLAYLACAITLITLSVLSGLWTVFSLACIGREQGVFSVDNSSNTYLPSYLVFQLSLLFMGTAALVLYLLFGLSAKNPGIATESPGPAAAIVRRAISIGNSGSDVEHAWGVPDTISRAAATTTILHYRTPQSTIDVGLESDQVVSIQERKK
jgi:hypothetical protein